VLECTVIVALSATMVYYARVLVTTERVVLMPNVSSAQVLAAVVLASMAVLQAAKHAD
jgi:hypothetical protein